MRGQLSGSSEDVKDMVLLLLCYFDEKEKSMFYYVEDTILAEEVQLEEVPLTPTVIVCGQSCYSAKRFMHNRPHQDHQLHFRLVSNVWELLQL